MRLIGRPLQLLTQQMTSWQKIIHDRTILETVHHRAVVMAGLFFLGFAVISVRLFNVMVMHSHSSKSQKLDVAVTKNSRADIIDRNGEVLATHLVTGSLYANPKVIIDPEAAALKLSTLFPELTYESLIKKLKSDKGFVWIVRHISPRLQNEVNNLGLPGVYLQKDERRVYPHGNLVSHVLGYCGIDNEGLAGVEKFFDQRLRTDKEPVQLAIDVRVQHIVREELQRGILEFQAEGGNAMVIDVESGDVVAMVSLPDFNPNLPNSNAIEATFNRNTLGIYESGSTFKIFNTSIALESGRAKLSTIYDASAPIRVGSKQISDFKGKNRPLTVREVFIYSSNIGSAKMALDFGSSLQRQYFELFGLMRQPVIELPEVSPPLLPRVWSDVTTMTVAYGYGIAVSPLMLVDGVRKIIAQESPRPLTLLKRTAAEEAKVENVSRVVSQKTSQHIRDLMRLVVTEGTAKKADVPGYDVIGKTGTAHKNQGGRGYNNARMVSFIGAFPKDHPRYIKILFLDNPKPTKATYGYATGGWTAAPVSGRIDARIAPLLGIAPNQEALMGNDQLNHLVAVNHKIEHVDEN